MPDGVPTYKNSKIFGTFGDNIWPAVLQTSVFVLAKDFSGQSPFIKIKAKNFLTIMNVSMNLKFYKETGKYSSCMI